MHDTLLKCLARIFDMYMLLRKKYKEKNVPACQRLQDENQKNFNQNIHGNHSSGYRITSDSRHQHQTPTTENQKNLRHQTKIEVHKRYKCMRHLQTSHNWSQPKWSSSGNFSPTLKLNRQRHSCWLVWSKSIIRISPFRSSTFLSAKSPWMSPRLCISTSCWRMRSLWREKFGWAKK